MKAIKIAMVMTGFAAAAVGGLAVQESLAKYEEPEYQLIEKQGNLEVRQYKSRLAASVDVAANADAPNTAFRILAGYIFGKNKGRTSLPMTVPVTQEVPPTKIAMTVPVTMVENDGRMRMSFFMPGKYTLESLPEPEDKRITFKTLPPTQFAVIRFSGIATKASVERQSNLLRAFMKDRGIQGAGEPIKASYNAPWTLPFMRRNEVWIEVVDSNGSQAQRQ